MLRNQLKQGLSDSVSAKCVHVIFRIKRSVQIPLGLRTQEKISL